jgi:hypothetical protein
MHWVILYHTDCRLITVLIIFTNFAFDNALTILGWNTKSIFCFNFMIIIIRYFVSAVRKYTPPVQWVQNFSSWISGSKMYYI